MKDICGNEIKAGHMVHLWWTDALGEKVDYLCTVCRTRGRGIKFVSDDGREFTPAFLEEQNAQIAIQGSQQQAKVEKGESTITTEELDMISRLRGKGWYGTIYKKTMEHSTFRIEMPELQ